MRMFLIQLTAARKAHLIGALACLAVAGLGYRFGVYPLQSEDKTPAQWQAEIDQAQAKAQRQAQAVQRFEEELTGSDRRLHERPMQLLQATQVNHRLAALSDLAGAHGLVLDASQPGGETRLAYYAYVPIQLAGQGGFTQVIGFLGALHTDFPDLSVRAFEMKRGAVDGGRFSLTLNWFVRPSQTAEVVTP